ncbi:MAG: tripartite tricarboxylate transporter substrate binding protein [Betaproteobacteria bacterium]|jgi:tripartite-type tricarboxylate transporter receptor subunit TctC|nr:MAG: tripartite tricarboxylate transporter substrate binding protein [Betaproteobacteria bacterium]
MPPVAVRGLFIAALVCVATAAFAQQNYPQKPIRYIVPFPAGGIADVFARIIGGRMSESWGQPVVVENRAGAGGNIGADFVAKAPPDGYTILMGSIGTQALNASLYRNMPYDSAKDFTPVALVIEAESLLALHPSVGANTPSELIALARSHGNKLSCASAGVGTTSHLACELFKSMARVELTHVPYKGNVPAITDLLGGQTSMSFATMPTVLPHVKAGKLKGIAVLGAGRSPAAPEFPALAETLTGFEVNNWVGTFGPAGLPSAITAKLNSEILALMRTPEVQQRLLAEGARFTPTTPEQFSAFVAVETAKWGKLIREVGIRAD